MGDTQVEEVMVEVRSVCLCVCKHGCPLMCCLCQHTPATSQRNHHAQADCLVLAWCVTCPDHHDCHHGVFQTPLPPPTHPPTRPPPDFQTRGCVCMCELTLVPYLHVQGSSQPIPLLQLLEDTCRVVNRGVTHSTHSTHPVSDVSADIA